ncbi:MAG: hypothetical protein HWN65_06910 [Candidatus Helarchaeota archaeon]|nr:hypothetical protein [Candidatus Helarchaeota archaeon]
MAEIPKMYKIYLLVVAIICFMYAILNIALTEIYIASLGPYFYYNPWGDRLTGFTLLCFGIFNVLAVMRPEWDKIKRYLEFGLLWMAFGLIQGVFQFADVNITSYPGVLMNTIVAYTFMAVFFALGLLLYLQERKKS